jgi:hypothetical protein
VLLFAIKPTYLNIQRGFKNTDSYFPLLTYLQNGIKFKKKTKSFKMGVIKAFRKVETRTVPFRLMKFQKISSPSGNSAA